MKLRLASLLAASCILAGALRAQTVVTIETTEPKITAGVGLDYVYGDYGFSKATELTSVPLNLSLEDGPWTVGTSIPYDTLSGPATVVGGGGVARPTSQSESGLGDIEGAVTYRFGAVVGGLNASFTERVEFPTASESRGLGTGEADSYSQFDFYQTFGESTPFATVGYRALGENAEYPLKSGIYLGAGSHFRLSPTSVLTVALDWGQRLLAGGQPTSDAAVVFTHDLDAHWQAAVHVLKGFTDASPDYGAGGQISYRF